MRSTRSSTKKNEEMQTNVVPDSSQPRRKGKQVSPKLRGRKSPSKSSADSVRVLRSRSTEKSKTPTEPVPTPVNIATKKGKRRKKLKTNSADEYVSIRKRVRYLLHRMHYEQSLIDAYAGEGWKGQSAEKLRPEKELERAKSEILSCKRKIRDQFRHLESLSADGRFHESLFDSEGQIDSDDIFCGKCKSKDSSIDNDIILCDGMCNRGFHQKCLNPPLLTAAIPTGDEGWLCPGCDCKLDVIKLVNESQGSTIYIEDTWENVFPEVADTGNGEKEGDDSSDDSDDYDYDPDRQEAAENQDNEKVHGEKSDSEESDFAAGEDSDASKHPKQSENFGFPSDDSEDDDDFNPDTPIPDKDIKEDGSSSDESDESDESDFTSDSDDFAKVISKSSANEDSASSRRRSGRHTQETDNGSNSQTLPTLDGELNIENVLASGKRRIERLDYKKKYDEEYGNLSESSEDEEWLESAKTSKPKKMKKDDNGEQSNVLSKAGTPNTKNKRNSKRVASQMQELDSDGTKFSTPVNRRLGSISSQKLLESFEEDQNPTREKRVSLAQELGLTLDEVDKWFENTCRDYASTENNVEKSKDNGNIQNVTMSLLQENPDYVIGQSSSGKEKTSAPAVEFTVVAENGSVPDNNTLGSSSSVMKSKGKKPATTSRSKAKSDTAKKDEGMTNIDKERQKAIARELKRMKRR